MSKTPTLFGIQYIRAFAAIAVVFVHIGGMMGEQKYYGRQPFDGVLNAGSVGVDLFFCLSGFIIVYIALDSHLQPRLRPADFFKRRFQRIIPFMWVIVLAYASLRFLGRHHHFPFWGYVRAITLFPVGPVEPSPVWTLRHEFLFYGVFALTYLTGRRWLFWVWVASPLIFFWAAGYSLPAFLFRDVDLLFGAGVLTGMLYVTRFHAITHRPALLAGLLGLIIILAGVIHYDRNSIPQLALIGVVSCVAVLVATGITGPRSGLGRLGMVLGDASYAIYLSHEMFISAILGIMAHRFPHAPAWTVFAACAAVAIPAGVAIHFWVEKPIIRLCKRGFSQKMRPAAPATPARLAASSD